jgi:hypothetical protein
MPSRTVTPIDFLNSRSALEGLMLGQQPADALAMAARIGVALTRRRHARQSRVIRLASSGTDMLQSGVHQPP